jgi:hypothetical protein
LAALFLVFILGIAAPSSILPSAGDRMGHAVLVGLQQLLVAPWVTRPWARIPHITSSSAPAP